MSCHDFLGMQAEEDVVARQLKRRIAEAEMQREECVSYPSYQANPLINGLCRWGALLRAHGLIP